jgi:hypothetical protein
MTKNVVTVGITATAAETAKKMQSENVGNVLVLDRVYLKDSLLTDR